MYNIEILNSLKTMHVMCMILASSESVFHGNFYALTNTFPAMEQLGINPRTAGGGGGTYVPPIGFSQIAEKWRRAAPPNLA